MGELCFFMSTRRILLLLVSLFASVAMMAQNVNVTVKLADASNDEPIGFATVSLTPEKGSAKYSLTDNNGKGTIEKVKVGKYTFKAEIMGYKSYEKAVEITKEATDLGVIKMELDQKVLDAASVTATGNPIIIKKDTVEYNASSFKTTDTDMLINLLKKLPGIEVDDSGTITANGETITKITIDGKTFFLDDPQLASQNLPAKMIEKVKVVKKKSEQAEFTGIDDGNDETIIDLSVQKSMMNGIFGNITGGVGHDIPSKTNDMNDWRYTGNGMVGRFTDSSQLSVIANGNNGAGGMGFTNMGGNMMGQMMGGGGGMGGFGGGMGGFGGGITTSWMGGVNAAADLLDNRMELSGNYMYSGSNTQSMQESYQENYFDGYTQIEETENTSYQRNNGHRVGVRLDHKFSDNTSILFQPQFNYSQGGYNQSQFFDTWRQDKGAEAVKSSDGFSTNYGLNSNWSANGFLLFRQRLGMPGRTLSLNLSWTLSNNHSNGYNQSVTNTISGFNPGLSLVNQRVDQGSRTQNAGARLVYTEPLGGGFYVEGSYQYNYSQSNSNKDVYNSLYNAMGTYDYDIAARTMEYLGDGEYDDAYSNKILNRNINQSAGLAFMYQEGDVRAQLGITANPQNQHNETNGKIYDNKVLNWAPRAMLFYDFNDNANIRINYNGRSGQPSTSQLMPVPDNSNPLSMTLGNPYLQPYFNHNGRIELEYSNRATFFTARLNLQGGMNQNPIVNAAWSENNVRYSFPVNGKNTLNGGARIMINAPIAKSNFSISNNSNINYSQSTSYVGSASLNTDRFWKDEDRSDFDYEAFHDAYPDLNSTPDFIVNSTKTLSVMERLNLNYRSDNFEVRLNGGTRFSKPWYSVKNENANDDITWNNSVGGSINWTIGYTGLTFTTDANYNWYNGYKTDQPSRLIWNAGLQMPIIYNSATIALNAYDMLGQRQNLSRNETGNYLSESRSLSIGRYVILSFTWRFGTFGGRNGRMGGFGGGRGGFGGGRGGRGGMGGGMMGGGMMGGGGFRGGF